VRWNAKKYGRGLARAEGVYFWLDFFAFFFYQEKKKVIVIRADSP